MTAVTGSTTAPSTRFRGRRVASAKSAHLASICCSCAAISDACSVFSAALRSSCSRSAFSASASQLLSFLSRSDLVRSISSWVRLSDTLLSCWIQLCSRPLSTSMHRSLARSWSCSLAISSLRFIPRWVSSPALSALAIATSSSSITDSLLSSSYPMLPRLGSSPLAILASIALTLSTSCASFRLLVASSLTRSSTIASSARILHSCSC
mmetsp:Transcript_36490/g.65268  ORF Transcript_36490/g.65268 Transcript_36490/m.65268 type:complete len:209 (+) Transcript_36490:410-1036(+)